MPCTVVLVGGKTEERPVVASDEVFNIELTERCRVRKFWGFLGML